MCQKLLISRTIFKYLYVKFSTKIVTLICGCHNFPMDAADNRAVTRSARGLDRELLQDRSLNYPHPRNGGSRGYPLWQRIRALDMMWGYNDYELAANAIGCHPISVRRWEQRITPFRMTGNRQRQRITAADQLLLSICLFIYPEANLDQICIFIVANGGDVYTRPTVSKRCKELGLSRKRSSREAYEAYSPASI